MLDFEHFSASSVSSRSIFGNFASVPKFRTTSFEYRLFSSDSTSNCFISSTERWQIGKPHRTAKSLPTTPLDVDIRCAVSS